MLRAACCVSNVACCMQVPENPVVGVQLSKGPSKQGLTTAAVLIALPCVLLVIVVLYLCWEYQTQSKRHSSSVGPSHRQGRSAQRHGSGHGAYHLTLNPHNFDPDLVPDNLKQAG